MDFKPLLRRLGTTLGWPQHSTSSGFTLPYGITEAQYQALVRLSKSEDFTTYRQTLDKVINLYAEKLLSTGEEVVRGQILGIRIAAELIDTLSITEKAQQHESRRRTEHSASGRAEKRRRATFSTPYWRNSS